MIHLFASIAVRTNINQNEQTCSAPVFSYTSSARLRDDGLKIWWCFFQAVPPAVTHPILLTPIMRYCCTKYRLNRAMIEEICSWMWSFCKVLNRLKGSYENLMHGSARSYHPNFVDCNALKCAFITNLVATNMDSRLVRASSLEFRNVSSRL